VSNDSGSCSKKNIVYISRQMASSIAAIQESLYNIQARRLVVLNETITSLETMYNQKIQDHLLHITALEFKHKLKIKKMKASKLKYKQAYYKLYVWAVRRLQTTRE